MEKPSLGDVLRPGWVRARGRESAKKAPESREILFRRPIHLQDGVEGHFDIKPPRWDEEKGREVKEVVSYILYGKDKEGNRVEVDLLERFNPLHVRVYEDPSIGFQAGECRDTSEGGSDVTLSAMHNQRSPHILLHELRHTLQRNEEWYKKLRFYYVRVDDAEFEREKSYTLQNQSQAEDIEKILASIVTPDEARNLVAPLREQIKKVDELARQAADIGGSLSDAIESTGSLYPNGGTELFDGVTVQDVLRLPTLVIERDAEYGALVSLRALKEEYGIDLLPVKDPGEKELREAQDVPLTTKTELRKRVDSLAAIQRYMSVIGVPEHCLRDIKAIDKSEPFPMLEKNKKMIEDESRKIGGRILRSGWLGTHGNESIPDEHEGYRAYMREQAAPLANARKVLNEAFDNAKDK